LSAMTAQDSALGGALGQVQSLTARLQGPGGALGVVILAIIAYALSMLCWLGALKHLPLGRAYSLLSISYALVYLLAASLPVFNEDFSLSKTLGVALVILGVLVINSRRASTSSPRNTP